MLSNAVGLYEPTSSGWGNNLVLTDVRFARNATPSNVGINGTGWLLARPAIRFVGNEYITYPASLRTAFDPNTFTRLYWLRLPTYSAASTIFYLTDGTNVLTIKHTAANTITIARTGGTNVVLSSVPEHQDILLGLTKSGNTLTAYAIHEGGTITSNQTDHSTSFGATTVMRDGYDGTHYSTVEFGVNGFYNTVKSQAAIENIHSQMYVVPYALAILNELGEDSGSDANETITSLPQNIYDVGVYDVDVSFTIINRPTANFLHFGFRYLDSNNHNFIQFTTTGIGLYKKVAGSSTSLLSTTVSDGDVIRLTARDSRMTIWKNDIKVGSSVATENQYNTRYNWYTPSTPSGYSITYTIKDTYGRALAGSDTDIADTATVNLELSRHRSVVYDGTLNPSSPFIKNVMGDSTFDGTREATLRKIGNELLFNGLTAAFSKPYLATHNAKPFTKLVLSNAFSGGGGGGGRYIDPRLADILSVSSASALSGQSDYVTTDAFASANNAITFGLNILVASTLDDSTDTIDLFANRALSLVSDTAGVGGQVTDSGDDIIGNNAISAGIRGFYGRMKRVIFIPNKFMQADLYDKIKRQQVTIEYRQRLLDLDFVDESTDVILFPSPNGTLVNVGAGGQPTNTATALGTTPSKTGDLPVSLNGTNCEVSILSLNQSWRLSEFDFEIRISVGTLTPAASKWIYIGQTANSYYVSIFENTSGVLVFASGIPSAETNITYTIPDTNEHTYRVIRSESLGIKALLVDGILHQAVALSGAWENANLTKSMLFSAGGSGYISATSPFVFMKNSVDSDYAIQAMQSVNLHTANGIDWLKYLFDNRNPIKLNNSSGKNLLASGGAADALSGAAAVGTERAPNGERLLTITSAGHVNIGLTALTMNNKRYSIFVHPATATLSTTLCYLFRLYIDADNYLDCYFSTTANTIVVDYRAGGATNSMSYGSMVVDSNYLIEIDIPSAGETAQLLINGTQRATVALTNNMVGTALSDANTVVGAISTSNTSHLQAYCTDLQIGEIPVDDLSDYDEAVGVLIS